MRRCCGARGGREGLDERFAWRGRDVAWRRLGSGPPVVLCHGTPWSSRLWAPFADALQDDYTVYLWDMAGYGQSSEAPEHPVDFGVQGELLAALLAHWELDRPRVVAHDFGGGGTAFEARGLDHDIDPEALADHVFVTFEGAFILCRSTEDNRHMRAQLTILRQLVETLLHGSDRRIAT